MDKATAMIWNNAEGHLNTWQKESPRRWWWGLVEEVVELGLALIGRHRHGISTEDVIEHELVQIGGIVLNWLRKRYRETGNEKSFEPSWDPYRALVSSEKRT